MLNKMSKEELELLSYTKLAEMYLKDNNKTMNTADLFKGICNLLDMGEAEYQEKIADFFQSLTTSKEFILLNDGTWDLKSHHSVKIDMNDIYEEKDEDYEIEEDNDELDELEDEYEDEDDSYDTSVEDYEDDDDLSDLTILDENEMEEE